MSVLGVDFGDTRTGVSISDGLGKLAQPLCTIESKNIAETAKKIADISKEKGITEIVIGMPKNMDGSLGFRAEATQKFGELVEKLATVKVIYIDERLTTISAGNFLNNCDVRGKRRKKIIDMVSAVIILQNYLDSK